MEHTTKRNQYNMTKILSLSPFLILSFSLSTILSAQALNQHLTHQIRPKLTLDLQIVNHLILNLLK